MGGRTIGSTVVVLVLLKFIYSPLLKLLTFTSSMFTSLLLLLLLLVLVLVLLLLLVLVIGVGDWRNNVGLNPIIIINVRYIGCICLHYHCTLFTIVITVIAGGYCCCVCVVNCCCLYNYT